MTRRSFAFRSLAIAALTAASLVSLADLTVPAYSSRPGAQYTLYLDFDGFDYSGQWSGKTPGVTPAYTVDADAANFSTAEKMNIGQIWARIAEKYTGFNVNVTTVDPAAKLANDAARQKYYDTTKQVMHTVVGGDGAWYVPRGGGYSFTGVTQNAYDPVANPAENGYHTNWAFSAFNATSSADLQYVAEDAAHENGHGLGLLHQSDTTTAPVTEYSPGDAPAASNGDSGVAPIMGNSYTKPRGEWRIGTKNDKTIQNDVSVLLGNANMTTLLDDNIGHSLLTATALAVSGGVVDPTKAKGFIVPADSAAPKAIGVDNYTKDYFAFKTGGGPFGLNLNAGAQRLSPGTADPGATFDGKLFILDVNGNPVGEATRDASTLFSFYDSNLLAGTYYAQVVSWGGYTSTREKDAQYYTMGSYFLTGNGDIQPIPEPGTLLAVGVGLTALARRRRRS